MAVTNSSKQHAWRIPGPLLYRPEKRHFNEMVQLKEHDGSAAKSSSSIRHTIKQMLYLGA